MFWDSVTGNGESFNTIALLENNKWSHVVGALVNDRVQLFINGKVDSTFQTGNFSTLRVTTHDLTFGRLGSSNGAEYFHGKLDDIRIYDRALSAAEVQALYNMGQ